MAFDLLQATDDSGQFLFAVCVPILPIFCLVMTFE